MANTCKKIYPNPKGPPGTGYPITNSIPYNCERPWSVPQPFGMCIPNKVASSEELDMRRKAEIFKYKNNDANMSKKMLYSQQIRGKTTKKTSWASQTQTITNPNTVELEQKDLTLICRNTEKNCAPSYANDVPGKTINICLDKNVPLTRYKEYMTPATGGGSWPSRRYKPGDKGFANGKSGSIPPSVFIEED